MSVTIN